MWKLSIIVALAALPGLAQPNNYGDANSWLCRPGQHDACDVDLTTTVIAPGGKLSRETWTADPHAPVDCFGVYPRPYRLIRRRTAT